MLNNLKLTNFKRHRDLTIDFTPGINATRGANEAGKSSMLHAIGYALFGTRALPLSLDDTVTWGEDPRTLKVELTLTVEGKTYTFTRSKAGAEVKYGDQVHVTGQNEVSAFASQLFGADVNTGDKLMFASQNGLRGALEEGPKALSVMIEDLGGFDAFDRILEAAQQKLVLGSPNLLEERLRGAEATLAAASESLPPKPDDEAHHAQVTALCNKMAEIEGQVPALEKAAEEATAQWQEGSRKYLQNVKANEDLQVAMKRLEDAKAQVEALRAEAEKAPNEARMATLRESIAAEADYDKRVVAHRIFRNLPDGDRWAGAADSFEAEVEANTKSRKDLSDELAKIDRQIVAAQNRRINHDKCDKCGQDVAHLAHVVETNAAVDAELVKLNQDKVPLADRLADEVRMESKLTAIRRFAGRLQPELNKLHGYVELDETTYPATATWVGEVPEGDRQSVTTLKDELQKLETEAKAIAAAKAKLELAQQQEAKAQGEWDAAVRARSEAPLTSAEDVIALEEAKNQAAQDLNAAKGNIVLAKNEVAELVAAFTSAKAMWKVCQDRINDAQTVIDNCKKDLDSLGFNNALVKKLRALRPMVADRLWNNVLSSVSVMFSQMRGEESWITKGKDGFRVNGQAVEGLSGSTLDLLGLAIRCALIRTFLPHCSLLILDEPAHGCDVSRTEALIGFIAGAGFEQVLLVTHEDVSESVADNLIQL